MPSLPKLSERSDKMGYRNKRGSGTKAEEVGNTGETSAKIPIKKQSYEGILNGENQRFKKFR